LTQLRSLGFAVVHFRYETVIEAFKRAGIDADFHEETADTEYSRMIRAWRRLRPRQKLRVSKGLLELNAEDIQGFMSRLEGAVTRRIQSVRILPLHGAAVECTSVDEAVAFVRAYVERSPTQPLVKYEVQISYNNGDRVEGQFAEKKDAIRFLHAHSRDQ
jgi:hypothetical protein